MVTQARAWLGSYDRSSLPADLVAGVTLAAYVLPAAIGDASLAGEGVVPVPACGDRIATAWLAGVRSLLRA